MEPFSFLSTGRVMPNVHSAGYPAKTVLFLT